jgi:hypothetical protein
LISLSPAFKPTVFRGVRLDPQHPFRFDFMIDEGARTIAAETSGDETRRLAGYFLASLAMPEKDLWVNLSPYENNRIIEENFGRTTMGRDILSIDYLLKQITSSLIYPDSAVGKRFWAEVYRRAYARYGTTDIPLETLNKVWIVPSRAVVYERADADSSGVSAYVGEARLRVMLDADYTASVRAGAGAVPLAVKDSTADLANTVMREIALPALEQEVNEGENFARLRQVYFSMLLAVWFKKKITRGQVGRGHILSEIFIDRKKTAGNETLNPEAEINGIYSTYLEAFRQGAYNMIREEVDFYSREMIPRKYFSGGLEFGNIGSVTQERRFSEIPEGAADQAQKVVTIDLVRVDAARQSWGVTDAAMSKLRLLSQAVSLAVVAASASGQVIIPIQTPPSAVPEFKVPSKFRMPHVAAKAVAALAVKYGYESPGVEGRTFFTDKRLKMSPEKFHAIVASAYQLSPSLKKLVPADMIDGLVLGLYMKESTMRVLPYNPRTGSVGPGQLTQEGWRAGRLRLAQNQNIAEEKIEPYVEKHFSFSEGANAEKHLMVYMAHLDDLAGIIEARWEDLLKEEPVFADRGLWSERVAKQHLLISYENAGPQKEARRGVKGLSQKQRIFKLSGTVFDAYFAGKTARGLVGEHVARVTGMMYGVDPLEMIGSVRNLLPLDDPGKVQQRLLAIDKAVTDNAQLGGVDLDTERMLLDIQGNGGDIRYRFTSEQIRMLNDTIEGFVPVIVNAPHVIRVAAFLNS